MLAVAFPSLHPLFESLAYAGGFAMYRMGRGRRGDHLSTERRWVVIAAAVLGAVVGSRALGLLELLPTQGWSWHALWTPGGGKTIVGGLLGGWISVEAAKQVAGIRSRTGDLFAIPLCLGIAIGRIGCFLAGIADDTYGKPTALPWGVDFGDGIPRHPTQLYEVVFLLSLAFYLHKRGERAQREGTQFRIFMAAYLGWRFLIDFLKPQPLVHGLNMIQWACLFGVVAVIAGEWPRRLEVQSA